MNDERTLVLCRTEIARLLTLEDCFAAVERAFRLLGEGKAETPGMMGIACDGGGFHIKAGRLKLQRDYFAAKVNGNFPANSSRFGLPTIQGVIVLCDAANGRPLALMDSMEITARRTAAATAVAAKYLARPESKTITICGCGNQGRAQLRALTEGFSFQKVYAYDLNEECSRRFAVECGAELGINVEAVADLGKATRRSDICVTCTTSQKPLLMEDDVSPGTFVAAVGADHPEKQELHPALLAKNKVIVDLLEQCATIGELHHAIAAGISDRSHVHAELGELVAGKRCGRTDKEEITIFDSTGMALQDVAAAAAAYERALATGGGHGIDLAA